jgi:starvation-inducible DNA-binding protein
LLSPVKVSKKLAPNQKGNSMRPQIQKKADQKQPSVNSQLGMVLNRMLADNINLKLQAKQAHWNIKGSNFIALHELFDAVSADADNYADMLAERVVQLGGIAAGTLEAVKEHSQLEAYPKTMQHNEQYIKALSASIKICADDCRNSIDIALEMEDNVTADLLTEVARGLDKKLWLVESNLQCK